MRNRALATLVAVMLVAIAGSAEAQRSSRSGLLRYRVESTPPGAKIFVDGAMESTSTTPAWLKLRRGNHKIRLTLDGHSAVEREVSVHRNWLKVMIPLTPLGVIQLEAGDETAVGARVEINGEDAGTLPVRRELEPGRYSYTVTREGYHPVTRWFELSGGQVFRVEVTLRPLPPPRGTILIAADVAGAQVFFDGTDIGTTPMIHEAEPGEHTIEIRAEEFEPHSEVLRVEAGQRHTVNATLRPTAPPGGTLVVLTEPAGATISIDGTERGTSPVTVEGLVPGTHIIEASLDGYEPATERPEVQVGRQETIRMELREIPRGASLRVQSSVAGAQVLLDGVAIGNAPLVHRDIPPGEHVVVVRAPGHRDWERRLTLEAGVELLVEATPDAFGRITVESETEGAEVVIDDEVVGTVPLEGHEVATGDHVVEVRAEGFEPFRTTVSVEPGGTHHLSARLAAPTPEVVEGEVEPASRRLPDRSGRRFVYSGFGLPPLAVSIDLAGGWPYIAGFYRIGLGLWAAGDWARLDLALAVRSSVYLTEIDARLRFGMRFASWFHLGVEVYFGGGGGRSYETTDELRAGLSFGLRLQEGFRVGPVAFGINQRLEVFIDTHGEVGNTGLVRQFSARVFVGAFVEWSVHRLVHVFLLGDYAPAQPERRILCGSAWQPETSATEGSCTHDWMKDYNFMIQAGVGFRFN